MDINFISWNAIPQETKREGWKGAYAEWYELTFPKATHKNSTQEFDASNEVWFLVNEPETGISIESDTGKYNPHDFNDSINQHRHTGQIKIRNCSPTTAKVTFIRLRKQLSIAEMKLALEEVAVDSTTTEMAA